MKTSQKKIVLENILLENKDSFKRISHLRDILMQQLDDHSCDKAALRRWINYHVKAMEANGLIESRKVPDTNKWEYRYNDSDLDAAPPVEQKKITEEELERSLDFYESQLFEMKIESKVFHQQLATYKEMQQDHPALAPYAKAKYQEVFEKRYDLGALIKTYEETLLDHGRSVSEWP